MQGLRYAAGQWPRLSGSCVNRLASMSGNWVKVCYVDEQCYICEGINWRVDSK